MYYVQQRARLRFADTFAILGARISILLASQISASQEPRFYGGTGGALSSQPLLIVHIKAVPGRE